MQEKTLYPVQTKEYFRLKFKEPLSPEEKNEIQQNWNQSEYHFLVDFEEMKLRTELKFEPVAKSTFIVLIGDERYRAQAAYTLSVVTADFIPKLADFGS